MKAIFRKEFRSLMLSASGITTLAIYLLFSGIIFTLFNLVYGYPSAEIVFSFLAIALIALLPVISCTAFTSERKNKTDGFLMTLPLTKAEILMGKYFARLAFIAIPTGIMAIYPIALDVFGEINYLGCYSALFALFLYEALLIAFGMMISALCKKSLSSFIITYVVLAVSFALPYVAVLLEKMLPEGITKIIENILMFFSPYGQFDSFSTGIFDLGKIVWFIAFSFITLAIAWLGLKREER